MSKGADNTARKLVIVDEDPKVEFKDGDDDGDIELLHHVYIVKDWDWICYLVIAICMEDALLKSRSAFDMDIRSIEIFCPGDPVTQHAAPPVVM